MCSEKLRKAQNSSDVTDAVGNGCRTNGQDGLAGHLSTLSRSSSKHALVVPFLLEEVMTTTPLFHYLKHLTKKVTELSTDTNNKAKNSDYI